MLLLSNLGGIEQGRQLNLECLRLRLRVINGQGIRLCKGAESRALPFTLHNNLSTGQQSYPQGGVGVIHRPAKPYPQVLSTDTTTYILPQKKFTLK